MLNILLHCTGKQLFQIALGNQDKSFNGFFKKHIIAQCCAKRYCMEHAMSLENYSCPAFKGNYWTFQASFVSHCLSLTLKDTSNLAMCLHI